MLLSVSRVILFSLVLLMLRIVVGIVMTESEPSGEVDAQVVLGYLSGYFLDTLVSVLVFARLARVQVEAPYIHAISVAVLQGLLGAVLLFAIVGTSYSSPLWLLDYAVLAVALVIGTEVGRRMRVIAGK